MINVECAASFLWRHSLQIIQDRANGSARSAPHRVTRSLSVVPSPEAGSTALSARAMTVLSRRTTVRYMRAAWRGRRRLRPCNAGDTDMAPEADIGRRGRWYHLRSIARSIAIHPRVYLAALTAALVALVLPSNVMPGLRFAIAGDLGALIYLALSFRVMLTCGSEVLRKRAARQDDSRGVILILVLVAIALSYWAVTGLLSEAKSMTGTARLLHIGLAALTIFLSWLMTQVVFTFHYAHEYYRPDDRAEKIARGLDFPADNKPDYWDFFYFATSLGAASQTSDVAIRTKALRRLVTLHAIVAFFFNTAVLALAINIGASLM